MAKDDEKVKSDTPATPEAAKPKGVLTDKDRRELTLAVRTTETSVMNPVEYEQMRIMANDMQASGALPESYKNADQVLMAIQLGKQMGFNPVEAVQRGYYVNGRYQVWGSAMPLALRRHGYRWKFKDESVNSVTVEIWNISDPEDIIEDTYTFDDAVRSGFTVDNNNRLKFGWREGANRKRKLRYGVLSQVINTYLPEVLGGVADIAEYSQDYIEGEVIQNDNAQAQQYKQDKIASKVANFEIKDTKAKAVNTDGEAKE
jgi:hypothetical protein